MKTDWYEKNKEQRKAQLREQYSNDPIFREKVLSKNQKYRINNKDKVSAITKSWKKNNRDYVNSKARYSYANNIQRKLSMLLRNRLNNAIKKEYRSGSAVTMLGCPISDFKIYLESKFQPGMSWDNQGSAWHIDHVVPLFHFDLSIKSEQEKACHYTNLQPLFAIDNLKKGKRK